MTPPFRRACLYAVLTLSLLLGGCASRLSYQFVDIWLAWSIDDYVTLDAKQEEMLDRRVEALVEWHRTTQLPRYIEWMEGIRQRVKSPMTTADFYSEFNRLNGFVNDVLRRAEPDALVLLATFSDAQIAELQTSLQRSNNEMLEEYRDMMPVKRQRQREDSASSNLQRWIGKLSRQERGIVRNWSRDMADIGEQRHIAREQWQGAFLQALTLRNDLAALQQALQPLLFEPQKFRNAEYSALLNDNQRKTFEMLAVVQQSLDKTQKKRLDLSLDSWIDTFKNLSASD